VYTHSPLAGSHLSCVQGLLSLQGFNTFEHAPVLMLQESMVQSSPSSQAAAWVQTPVPGVQASLVQILLSEQSFGIATHPPAEAEQTAARQGSAGAWQEIGSNLHPVTVLHESLVHRLLSSHAISTYWH
jgi:hypothetical protein